MKRKQSLRARLRRQETILDRVEKQKERLEEESVQRMLRLASNVSQDAMPPTAAAIRTVHTCNILYLVCNFRRICTHGIQGVECFRA